MARPKRTNFSDAATVRTFPNGSLRVISLGEVIFGDYALRPGWRWSEDIKPIAGTRTCEHHHVGYAMTGQLHVEMDDGTTLEIGPGDAYDIPPGHDAWVVGDEACTAIEFSGSRNFAVSPDELGGGVVGTLLFTDIIGSTEILARVGDATWSGMLLAHNARMRTEIDRHRGRELATTGDGFLAMFDSASRAVRCGHAMAKASEADGLRIRVGCHKGEVDLVGGEARGVAVHTAARVLSLAGPGEVFASWTTNDLLAGSGLALQSVGMHELKGLAGSREVFRVLAG